MLTSLEQLEKDIELFKRNITNSNELCASLEALVQAIKRQNIFIDDQTCRIMKSVDQSRQYLEAHYQSLLDVSLEALDKKQDEFCEQAAQLMRANIEGKEELEEKYNLFLGTLSETNMDQIYKLCCHIKSNLDKKINLLLGGLAIVIILFVVSVFVK